MSSSDRPPSADEQPEDRDPVSAIVEEFAYLCAERGGVDLDDFCGRWPDALRPEIRRRCEDALAVQSLLGQSESPASAVATPRRIGEFEIVRELGRGGMGVVYLAFQESLRRDVALKVLALNPAIGARAVERFRREARSAGRLVHPGIVHVLSVGEAEGSMYIAMEYVEGATLAEHLRVPARTAIPGWQLGQVRDRGYPARVAGLVAEVADALHFAHQNGVIHRDIKPGNVLMDPQGHPHVLDFGLAKDLGDASISLPGDLAGTPYYMSPEQALAKRIGVDHRTDVYSLGVVLYELLTGARPFEGDSLEKILFAISFGTPRPLRRLNPRVPRDLETICQTAIEKNPAHRYDDAAAMARDLRHFLDYESLEVHPPGPARRLWRLAVQRRREVVTALMAAVVVALVAGMISRVRRSSDLDDAMREVRLASAGELAEQDALQLRDLRRSLAELLQQPDLDAGRAEELAGIDARVTAEAVVRRDEAVTGFYAELDSLQTAPRPDGVLDLLGRLGDLEQAAWLLPEDEQIAALLGEALPLPRLTVRVDPLYDGARVFARLIDPFTGDLGPRLELGTAPLVRAVVDPGFYRIVVEEPTIGFAECTRMLPLGLEEVVHAWIRPTTTLVADMAEIEGGRFVFGDDDAGHLPMQRHERGIDAFRIDVDEVTGAEYMEFLDATGWPPPLQWGGERDPRLAALPVSALSFEDARAYAEWSGKRLPTMFEWERAARGTEGRLFPWADGMPAVLTDWANVQVAQASEAGGDLYAGILRDHLAHARPPGWAPAEAATPEGVRDLLGNVSEWTESMPVESMPNGTGERLVANETERVIKGLSWAVGPIQLAPRYGVVPTMMVSRGVISPMAGLRCAKSVEP